MCFLSRPRRFGKTLTVSTLEAIFQGRRELFKDLAIDKTDYDWKTYPVIPIDFGDMCDALKAGETKRYMEVLASFFAGIPYMDGRKKEADYALVVAALARLMRRQVVAAVEERTSEGRIDLSVVAGEHVYVMEYKVDKSAEAALRQIKEKRYADKFRLEKGKTIHLLGIAFSSTGHTVQEWKEEVLD